MAASLDSRRVHASRIERDSRVSREARRLGLCHCGCGEKTNLAKFTSKDKGWTKGEPHLFVLGHQNRAKRRPPICEDDYTVEDCGYATPCWVRRGFLSNKGYGHIRIAGKLMLAHRAIYEQEVGPIPHGMTIDHLCRVRACMRPDHLEVVPLHVNLHRGNGAKITAEQAAEIRIAPGGVSSKELAARYGLHPSSVSRIRRGLRWAKT